MENKSGKNDFATVQALFKSFAKAANGLYLHQVGISDKEIELSKSSSSKWLDAQVVNPLLEFLGYDSSAAAMKQEFDRHYENALVDCGFRETVIRFHSRNVGFGFETAGKFGLRVTADVVKCPFRFFLTRKQSVSSSSSSRVPKPSGKRLSRVLRAVIPESLVNRIEIDQNDMLRTSLVFSSELYSASATNKELGQKLLSHPDIQLYLQSHQDIFFMSIGYPDWKLDKDVPIVELNESVSYADTQILGETQVMVTAVLELLARE